MWVWATHYQEWKIMAFKHQFYGSSWQCLTKRAITKLAATAWSTPSASGPSSRRCRWRSSASSPSSFRSVTSPASSGGSFRRRQPSRWSTTSPSSSRSPASGTRRRWNTSWSGPSWGRIRWTFFFLILARGLYSKVKRPEHLPIM